MSQQEEQVQQQQQPQTKQPNKFLYVHIQAQHSQYSFLTWDRLQNETLLKPLGKKLVRCVVISDTHNLHDQFIERQYLPLPQEQHGDILIHAGDFSNNGTPGECMSFNAFLLKMTPHFKYRVGMLVFLIILEILFYNFLEP